MVKDPYAKLRYDREVMQARETADKVMRDARESHQAGHINADTLKVITDGATFYLDGTIALLREVYGMDGK
jgi:hypothetical protein